MCVCVCITLTLFHVCSFTAWKKMADRQQRRFLTVLNIGKIFFLTGGIEKKACSV